jgi:acyl-CoA thioester hydrolase
MSFAFGIWRGEAHITSGELVYVNADPATRTSAPWPQSLRAAILDYEKTPPEG